MKALKEEQLEIDGLYRVSFPDFSNPICEGCVLIYKNGGFYRTSKKRCRDGKVGGFCHQSFVKEYRYYKYVDGQEITGRVKVIGEL